MIVGYIATQPQKDRKVEFSKNRSLSIFFGGLPKTINLPYKRDKNDGQKSGNPSLQHGIPAAAGGPGLHPAAPWKNRALPRKTSGFTQN